MKNRAEGKKELPGAETESRRDLGSGGGYANIKQSLVWCKWRLETWLSNIKCPSNHINIRHHNNSKTYNKREEIYVSNDLENVMREKGISYSLPKINEVCDSVHNYNQLSYQGKVSAYKSETSWLVTELNRLLQHQKESGQWRLKRQWSRKGSYLGSRKWWGVMIKLTAELQAFWSRWNVHRRRHATKSKGD